MKNEMIQLAGKKHKEYIFNLAIELWEKSKWDKELDDWIKEALRIHRETVRKAMLAEKTTLFCEMCGDVLNKTNESYLVNLCMKCWRRKYVQNLLG